ncbi:zinc metalloprotease [Lutibacter sp. TH_r2]|uniref:zinc metalloprotease n=1 Tax=Lutibacter sp. TH_r2 TaxID=3082083 RepID=UPI0029541CC4|nr:zinc metalloprotease [Lutibacter sp. TH_r2]MDV7186740.1 zinc metalloprotease [Lutibacter sp. TH_r2]
MKKLILSLTVIAMVAVSCNNDSNEIIPTQEISEVDMSDFYLYTDKDDNGTTAKSSQGSEDKCYSMHVLNRQLNENPGLYQKMYNVEKHTRQFITAKKPDGNPGGGNNGGGDTGGGTDPVDDGLGTINIPVYVYVIYANSSQNISDSQINSQITVLNNDFNDTNYNDIPSEFQGVAADIDINFTLATVDRRSNSTSSWGTNNTVKSVYPAVSGHLTIWVANIGGGILGYAQFPGGSASTDGVVISPQYFGTTGSATAPFDKGRTATHEVGHWLNLRHIWGDGRCRQDDFVDDTPSSDGANYGCPSYPTVNCKSNDMTMNYMDYTDDACMNMFTEGQKTRMRAIFAPGGSRENLHP